MQAIDIVAEAVGPLLTLRNLFLPLAGVLVGLMAASFARDVGYQ